MDEPAVAAMAYEDSVNFKSDIADILHSKLIQSATRRPDKVYDVNVINDGDPLEIYTSRDGEVIFKKYSLLGGVEDFAGQLCESVSKSTGAICAVTDRDNIVSVAGGGRKELLGKHISPELEEHLESRKVYQFEPAQPPMDAIPVEVTAEQNLQSKKLKVFREKFQPKQSIRTSLANYRREPGLLNLPLWAIETL